MYLPETVIGLNFGWASLPYDAISNEAKRLLGIYNPDELDASGEGA